MKYYKVTAYGFDGRIVKESDPHPWEKCKEIQQEYMTYDHVGATSISTLNVRLILAGKTGDQDA